MNISIDDIKYLERFANEEPCGGKVWKMANEGKTYYEIAVEVGEIAVEVGDHRWGKSGRSLSAVRQGEAGETLKGEWKMNEIQMREMNVSRET